MCILISLKQAQPFTRQVRNIGQKKKSKKPFYLKKVEGGAQVFILCMCILLFLVVLYKFMFDYQRMDITKDNVDDAITTSLLASCVYNREELGASGAPVIYRTVTPLLGDITVTPGGVPILDTQPLDVLNLPALSAPTGDSYLTNCYNRFVKTLKTNLRLNASMESLTSGISGEVVIMEFSVFNKFYNLDEDRNQTDFRFVKYTYNTSAGTWSAYPYNINQYPTTYNSLDKANYTITETSVSAKLGFSVNAGTIVGWDPDPAGRVGSDNLVPVTYQRVVDVKLD